MAQTRYTILWLVMFFAATFCGMLALAGFGFVEDAGLDIRTGVTGAVGFAGWFWHLINLIKTQTKYLQ